MNKTLKMAAILSLFLFIGNATPAAARKPFGLGMIVGDPTGLSAKLWLNDRQAVAGALAWSFRGEGAMDIHVDYLLHHALSGKTVDDLKPVKPYFYYGIGGRIKDEPENRIGVRMPLGIVGGFTNAPFDIYMEIVPLLDLAPATEFDLNAALGARFYF